MNALQRIKRSLVVAQHSTDGPCDYQPIIECFLQINPDPSDEQVHAFASSLGVDKEELEAVFYEMLGTELSQNQDQETGRLFTASEVKALTEDERILIDDYDPLITDPKGLSLNDSSRTELTLLPVVDDGELDPEQDLPETPFDLE